MTLVTVPSVSVPAKLTAILVSSLPLEMLGVAVGPSWTLLTVITSLAGAETLFSLSVTVNTMVTLPLKLATGTNTRVAASAAVIGVLAKTGVVPSAR